MEVPRRLVATTRASRRTMRWWEMVGWATSRFHNVGYEALVADHLGEVERLYGRLGVPLPGAPGSA